MSDVREGVWLEVSRLLGDEISLATSGERNLHARWADVAQSSGANHFRHIGAALAAGRAVLSNVSQGYSYPKDWRLVYGLPIIDLPTGTKEPVRLKGLIELILFSRLSGGEVTPDRINAEYQDLRRDLTVTHPVSEPSECALPGVTWESVVGRIVENTLRLHPQLPES